MFILSKKVEYGLIVIRHMASGVRTQIYSAKEIADAYQIPYEILAKVMQKLSKHGFLRSFQGTKGGYSLNRDPNEIKISEIIYAFEGKTAISIVQCEAEEPGNCHIHNRCTIKIPVAKLQNDINKFIQDLTVTEMFS